MKSYFILTAALCLAASASHATTSTANIGGAGVTKGKAVTEVRFGFEGFDGDDTYRFRQHFDYGVNDWYAVRLVGNQIKRESSKFDYVATGIDNRFQLKSKAVDGWNAGVRLSYNARENADNADSISFTAIAETDLNERFTLLHNTVIAHDIGHDSQSGVSATIRNRLTYKFLEENSPFKGIAAGLEHFSNFGRLKNLSGYSNQDHQLGAYVGGKLSSNASYRVAYRRGISNAAPNDLAKLALGYSF